MFTFAGKLHINNFSCIMANVIKIKKGLDINLKGKASDVLLNLSLIHISEPTRPY